MTTDPTQPSLEKPAIATRGSSTSSRPPLPPQSHAAATSPLPSSPPSKPTSPELSGAAMNKQDAPLPGTKLAPAIKKANGGGHSRKISWGALTTKLQQPDLSSAVLSSNAPSSGRITQEELDSHMPTETEGEAYIFNSLDNLDPTMGRRSEKSILSNITDTDLQALHANDSGSVKSSERRSSASVNRSGSSKSKKSLFKVASVVRAQQHRRKETVGDRLSGLAAAMDAVHMQNLDFLDDANAGPPVLDINLSETKPASCSADAFRHNTTLIYQRHASKRAGLGDSEAGSTSPPSPYLSSTPADVNASTGVSAERRWKMLKHAVAATSMMDGAQKSTVTESNNLEVPTASEDRHEDCVSGESDSNSEKDGEDPRGKRKGSRRRARNKAERVFRDFQDFVAPRSSTTYTLYKVGLLFIMLPSATIAGILFYFGGNPPTGVIDLERSAISGVLFNEDGHVVSDESVSASWWLLFLGVRQVSVILLAKFLEVLFIDVLSVRSKFSVQAFGPWATLFLLQTKGWPFMAFTWGMLSVGLLSGSKPFFHHWGYWQDYIELFNEKNPSGQVVNSDTNHRVTAVAIAIGVIVSCKRFWLGLYLGRQTFAQFSDRLAAVMKKILLVSEVASLGRAFERYVSTHKDVQTRRSVSATHYGVNKSSLEGMISSAPEESSPGNTTSQEAVDTADAKYVIDPEDRHPMTGQLSQGQKARIVTLLGTWSEPTLAEKVETSATVNEILQFRRALEYLHTPYPFSGSFGLADRRESVIESAQEVYDRLLFRSPDPDTLNYDVVALLGVQSNGELDSEKLKDLIKLFRPGRDGTMECVHFVKAIDEVYKELRLLRASVANSTKIDRAFENIFNFVFYAILACLILSQLGYDPLALFLSISGVILAFAFMIGSASSKYFEGILFILARRPYQIGDGIALSGVNEQTLSTGSPMWVVEDVDLFTTKVVFSFTGEKATLSNGALAASRVINASESKEASLYVLVKFPIEMSFHDVRIFKDQLTDFFKNRPREWIAFTRFRPTRFEINEGFVEYIICAQHRLPWSKFGDLQQSRSELMQFCMELQKSMKLLFKQPPQPVDVNLRNVANLTEGMPMSPYQAPPSPGASVATEGSAKYAALQALFAPKSD